MSKDNILNPEGLFDPSLRFAFTNITEEEFVSHWNGSPIKIKPGDTIELSHHLAVKLTKELVDSIMIGNAKLDELAKNQPYYRSPMGSSLGVPAARKVWEDKICRQLEVNEESPEMQIMRAKIREEIMSDLQAEPTGGTPLSVAPGSIAEFSDLNNARKEDKEKEEIKVKKIKVK